MEITKPTRVDVAIENMKSRLKQTERDIALLTRQRDTLHNEISEMEKIRDDKSFD